MILAEIHQPNNFLANSRFNMRLRTSLTDTAWRRTPSANSSPPTSGNRRPPPPRVSRTGTPTPHHKNNSPANTRYQTPSSRAGRCTRPASLHSSPATKEKVTSQPHTKGQTQPLTKARAQILGVTRPSKHIRTTWLC